MKDSRKQAVLTAVSVVASLSAAAAIGYLTLKLGEYECPRCGERFSPSPLEYVSAIHMFNKRRLTCPACGNKSFCQYFFKNK